MFRRLTASLSVAALLLAGASVTRSAQEEPLRRFAFGSCAKQDQPQPIWEAVLETKPQLFTFLGDNIYGDTEDMEVLRRKYAQLGAQPGYRKLKESCEIRATWDDHDYGVNDGGAEYPKKRESQQVFLEFFEVPRDDPRWRQEGIYHSELLGPPGRRVQLILLDARYHRGPLKKGVNRTEPGEGYRGSYVPNDDPSATVLGETQWKWLEAQLRVPADLRLIGSGIQVVSEEHGWEHWGNFPRERQRLLRLVRRTGAEGVVFLSGDRHLAEISRQQPGRDAATYPLYDVTSSSLNAPNPNFSKARVRFGNEINRHRVGLTYFETNFGFVEIDWDQPTPVVRLQVRDKNCGVVLQQRLSLSDLQR
ncbi:MAG: alkaline phosphatase D family protein [Armatimonadota bacterium]